MALIKMIPVGSGSGIQTGTYTPSTISEEIPIDTHLSDINGFILFRYDPSYTVYQTGLRYEKSDPTKFYAFSSQKESSGIYSDFTSTANARLYVVKSVLNGIITIICPNTASYNSGTLYWYAW